ncbi:hypothetical protein SAMN05444680_1171, partial [Variovorax sp. YR216]
MTKTFARDVCLAVAMAVLASCGGGGSSGGIAIVAGSNTGATGATGMAPGSATAQQSLLDRTTS